MHGISWSNQKSGKICEFFNHKIKLKTDLTLQKLNGRSSGNYDIK